MKSLFLFLACMSLAITYSIHVMITTSSASTTKNNLKGEKIYAKNNTTISMSALPNNNNTNNVILEKNIIETPNMFDRTEICSYFSNGPITSQLWTTHLSQIYNASHHPTMQHIFRTISSSSITTNEAKMLHNLLFNVITPTLLRKGLVNIPLSRPTSHAIVQNIVEKLQNRINNPLIHPPLNIVVIGGSVVQGRGCVPEQYKTYQGVCAWPRRLELLVNQFFADASGSNTTLIKVHNLSIGGTNTNGIGTRLIKFWLYPDIDGLKSVGPDIIINGYSTNDSNPNGQLQPEEKIEYVFEKAFTFNQEFLREALSSKKPCGVPPLVVNIDDYLGPLQELLLGELQYNTAVGRLAKWYDTMFVSYADVVRDLVYKNTTDDTFFNEKDVHYGRWAHQTTAWLLGFSFIDLLNKYCSDEHQLRKVAKGASQEQNQYPNREEVEENGFFLPPPLTKTLQLSNITAEVVSARESTMIRKCNATSDDDKIRDRNPCALAWVASPGLFNHLQIKSFMRKYQTNVIDWNVESDYKNGGWQGKFGWVAASPNATFTLSFPQFLSPVKTVTIIFLRSYGEKWKDSQVQLTVSADISNDLESENLLNEFKLDDDRMPILGKLNIWGVHNNTNSPTLSETLVLNREVPAGRRFKMKVDMVSGNTFKILGLNFCL